MTVTSQTPQRQFLLARAASRTCAVPLAHVVETMRPLPVRDVRGAPDFVAGVSVIRGAPTPVVTLGALLGAPSAPGRFVTLRLGARALALAVDGVVGIHEIPEADLQSLPPLLQGAQGEIVEAVGTLDAELLVVLRAARILPDELWRSLSLQEGRP